MYLIPIIAAALLFSISEVLIYRYSQSIFHSMSNQNFWNMALSAYKKKFLWYRWDGVNISKSLAIMMLILASMVAQNEKVQLWNIPWGLQFLIAIIIFVVTFNFGYHKLFIHKHPQS